MGKALNLLSPLGYDWKIELQSLVPSHERFRRYIGNDLQWEVPETMTLSKNKMAAEVNPVTGRKYSILLQEYHCYSYAVCTCQYDCYNEEKKLILEMAFGTTS
jgi:hypothetical protein